MTLLCNLSTPNEQVFCTFSSHHPHPSCAFFPPAAIWGKPMKCRHTLFMPEDPGGGLAHRSRLASVGHSAATCRETRGINIGTDVCHSSEPCGMCWQARQHTGTLLRAAWGPGPRRAGYITFPKASLLIFFQSKPRQILGIFLA